MSFLSFLWKKSNEPANKRAAIKKKFFTLKKDFTKLQRDWNTLHQSNFFNNLAKFTKLFSEYLNEMVSTEKRINEMIISFTQNNKKNVNLDLIFSQINQVNMKYLHPLHQIFGETVNQNRKMKDQFIRQCPRLLISEYKTDSLIYITIGRAMYGTLNGEGFRIQKPRSFIGKSGANNHVIYTGKFLNGMKDGYGEEFNEDGNLIYKGYFRIGRRSGKGIEFINNNKNKNNREGQMIRYEGQFKEGRYHGYGEYYDPKKRIMYKGVFENNRLKEKEYILEIPKIPYSYIEQYLTHTNRIDQGSYGDIYVLEKKIVEPFFSNNNNNSNLSSFSNNLLAIKIYKTSNQGLSSEKAIRLMQTKYICQLCKNIKDKTYILNILGIVEGIKNVGYITEYLPKCVDKMKYFKSNNNNNNNEKFHEFIEEKLIILYQVAKGMKSLHFHNIMHRDLKWGNVMLDNNNNVKIMDFDFLKRDNNKWKLNEVTHTMISIGTIEFLAPEIWFSKKMKNDDNFNIQKFSKNVLKEEEEENDQKRKYYEGHNYTKNIDVFSYGLMIFSLLFGVRNPYLYQNKNKNNKKSKNCCSCGKQIDQIERNSELIEHVYFHNLRPFLPEEIVFDQKNKKIVFLFDLMIFCWDSNPLKRPTFENIVEIFEAEKKGEIKYSIITIKRLGGVENKMFLMHNNNRNKKKKKRENSNLNSNYYYENILFWIEKIFFENSSVDGLYSTENKMNKISSNEDIKRMISQHGKYFTIFFDSK